MWLGFTFFMLFVAGYVQAADMRKVIGVRVPLKCPEALRMLLYLTPDDLVRFELPNFRQVEQTVLNFSESVTNPEATKITIIYYYLPDQVENPLSALNLEQVRKIPYLNSAEEIQTGWNPTVQVGAIGIMTGEKRLYHMELLELAPQGAIFLGGSRYTHSGEDGSRLFEAEIPEKLGIRDQIRDGLFYFRINIVRTDRK